MKKVEYAVRLQPGFIGGYFATCRDLPTVQASGGNYSETILFASEMIDLVLTLMLDEDTSPPEPTPALAGEVWVSPSVHMQSLLKPYFSQMPDINDV